MSTRHRRRVSGRWATAAILILIIAAPAAASVVTQNFLRADVSTDAACFVTAEGPDATDFGLASADPYADVDLTATITNPTTGVTLLQEQVTVTGYEGDRITYTDVVRYENDCDYDVSLRLVVGDDAAGNPGFVASDWTDKAVSIHLSTGVGVGTDFGVAADWDQSPIVVAKGDAAPTNGASGIVTVPAGGAVQGAFVIEVDQQGGAFASTTGTIRYTAEATAIP
jgi:hypothetical protein